jgi:RNA polymerase-binding transcription factor DksA
MATRPTRFAPKTQDALVEFLTARRVALARRAATLNCEVADALRGRDISDALDEEAPAPDADIATHLILIERAEERLQEIDAALRRVAEDTYGYCVRCGARIPLQRLRALPAAATCVECSGRFARDAADCSYTKPGGIRDPISGGTRLLVAGGEQ